MASFAERYGFQFRCHEIRHANRKAGNERSFWTVETNFLPGRTFDSLEDMNRQALRVGHDPHVPSPGQQDRPDSGQGLRARTAAI